MTYPMLWGGAAALWRPLNFHPRRSSCPARALPGLPGHRPLKPGATAGQDGGRPRAARRDPAEGASPELHGFCATECCPLQKALLNDTARRMDWLLLGTRRLCPAPSPCANPRQPAAGPRHRRDPEPRDPRSPRRVARPADRASAFGMRGARPPGRRPWPCSWPGAQPLS